MRWVKAHPTHNMAFDRPEREIIAQTRTRRLHLTF
jgi:hypothetical protein